MNQLGSESFQDTKSYFDERFDNINTKFASKTKQPAKRFKNQRTTSSNFKASKMQYLFNMNLKQDFKQVVCSI